MNGVDPSAVATPRPRAGGEARRAVVATVLGIALGVVVAVFSRRDDARAARAR